MRSVRRRLPRAVGEIAMLAIGAGFIFPIYVLATLAFKPQAEWQKYPLGLPHSLFMQNFADAWDQAGLATALLSSTIVVAVSIAILVLFGSLGAFAIARRGGKLGYGLYIFFLAGLVLPFQLALIPLYKLMRDFGLLGSPGSLILFYAGLQMPLTIFLYAGFVRALSRSYEEAAAIDGATRLQAFWHVVFPMLRPVTGTVIILNGVFIWNDFMTPLLYLSGSDWQTVPVAVYSFAGQYVSDWGIIFAGLVIGILPVVIVFFALQRQLIHGFAGGLKG
jgi:raffinose/stachyose/melibiose transport system permease protein